MTATPNRTHWPGLILTTLVTLLVSFSAAGKLAGSIKMVSGLRRAGIPEAAITPIGILEFFCVALYLFPRTAGMGTLLLTGFFGGATLTHLIAHESLVPPLLVGMMIWAGAYFRIPKFRELLPFSFPPGSRGSHETRTRQPFAPQPGGIA